jgi:GTP cyclohydrolase II
VGIARKLDAIALQQEHGINTAQAFEQLGLQTEPRTFDNHVEALRRVFSGSAVRMASRNPAKIEALTRVGIEVVERITLETAMTEERLDYLSGKLTALGHHQP